MDLTRVLVLEFKTPTGEVAKVQINKPAQGISGSEIKPAGDTVAASNVICITDAETGVQTPATTFSNAYFMIMTKQTVAW